MDLRYCLTLRQPWAGAVAHLGKDVENRTRMPPAPILGSHLMIHAGLAYDVAGARWLGEMFGEETVAGISHFRGVIVAVAEVIGVVRELGKSGSWHITGVGHLDSRWLHGPVGICFSKVVALRTPAPCRGMQGYFEPSQDVIEAVRSGL